MTELEAIVAATQTVSRGIKVEKSVRGDHKVYTLSSTQRMELNQRRQRSLVKIQSASADVAIVCHKGGVPSGSFGVSSLERSKYIRSAM